ncbi:hypothetical protein BBbe_11520 [Bartonella bovis 91-4]|uniref:Uncharacterized protein n=1 Tax=Bartonella bovis 91-4 TaxID=1094491 RepID=N6UC92_9HYPH|nr:hypothetical protein BBbe_11520 [Bartonella bovis 91-4]
MGFFTRHPPSSLGSRNQTFPSVVAVHHFPFHPGNLFLRSGTPHSTQSTPFHQCSPLSTKHSLLIAHPPLHSPLLNPWHPSNSIPASIDSYSSTNTIISSHSLPHTSQTSPKIFSSNTPNPSRLHQPRLFAHPSLLHKDQASPTPRTLPTRTNLTLPSQFVFFSSTNITIPSHSLLRISQPPNFHFLPKFALKLSSPQTSSPLKNPPTRTPRLNALIHTVHTPSLSHQPRTTRAPHIFSPAHSSLPLSPYLLFFIHLFS